MATGRSGDPAEEHQQAQPPTASAPVRRLRRTERREQILAAATGAFARGGFSATGLEDVAAAAGISRAILYRHFDSKTDLYRAVLDRARKQLTTAAGASDFTWDSVEAMLGAASQDPDGFRLLFRHAAREPEFREQTDRFRAAMETTARRELSAVIREPAWLGWAAHLAPVVAVEAVMAWLDAGKPDPDQAAQRVQQAIAGVVGAAAQPRPTSPGRLSDHQQIPGT